MHRMRTEPLHLGLGPFVAGVRGQAREPDALDPRVARSAARPAPPPRPATARSAAPASAARAAPARPRTARRCRRGWCGGAAALARSPASDVTRAPSTTSEWPDRYLVTECRTTSEPSAQRLLHQGRGEGVVRDDDGAGLVRGGGQRTDVGDAEHRVGGALQPQHVGGPSVRRGELRQDGVGVRDVHRAQFQEALFRQFGGHHQRARVAVGRHHQHAAGGHQGQGRTDGGEAGGVEQAGQRRRLQAGPGPLRRGPRWGWNSGRSRGRRRPAVRCRSRSRTAPSAG